jgi:antitoxin VapB
MGIFIKNPETEKAVREIAALRGETITGVIDALAREALAREITARAPVPHRKRTLEEMRAATAEFRRISGLDKLPPKPVTKAEWDALWPTGIPEIDDA